MLRFLRNLNLFHRGLAYTLAMGLLAMVFVGWWPWPGKSPFLLPWLICYGAGLASMVIVEPFRHSKGSPYGFLLGSAARTAPPLVLVIIFVATRQPVDHLFWISLLFSYFFMLVSVITLTIPAQPVDEQGKTGNAHEKSEEKTE